jgi:hypothetical protein
MTSNYEIIYLVQGITFRTPIIPEKLDNLEMYEI